METEDRTPAEPQETRCAECGTQLVPGQDQVATEDGVFCRPCFNNLTAHLEQVVVAQSENINYPMAALGGLIGGAAGVLVWWGFTVLTNVAFGLVAVVIGFTVGKGVVILSGNRRATGLQVLSVIIASLSFFYASYLVTRTFVFKAYAEGGQVIDLPWVPSPQVFFDVVRIGFGFMDLLFLAFAVYQAWKIPQPFKLAG